MEAAEFLGYFEGHNRFASVIGNGDTPPGGKFHLHGLIGSSKTIALTVLFKRTAKNIVALLNSREEAAYFFDDLNNLGFGEKTLFFPSSYKRSIQYGQPEQENIVLRAGVLNKLTERKKHIIVTYPEALAEKVITRPALKKNTLQLSKGDKISIEFINEFLFEFGFERVDFVYEPGQFSVRGSIVDIFSFSNEDPYRIDFFGDEVDSIRCFDIDNQISKSVLPKITIVPNIQTNDGTEDRISFAEFLSERDLIFGDGIRFFLDQVNAIRKQTLLINTGIKNSFDNEMVSGDELQKQFNALTVIEASRAPVFLPTHTFEFSTSKQPVFNKNFTLLGENLIEYSGNGYRIFLLSKSEQQIERLRDIFEDTDIRIEFTALSFILHEGFIDHDLQICCYTDHQIFERYHRFNLHSRKSQRESVSLKELNKLHPGDYVVHIDHGIGKFAGLVKTEVNGKMQEAIRLVYQNNDSLLVSIHSLHRVSKYKGKDDTEPVMNRLGSGAWQKLKNRTKAKVKDIARELIALYAKRKAENGFTFSQDTYLQSELEASFIYEDTPDQQKATASVKEDMEKPIPMDRLVCGDVGFGKTEIAIRAAFKAVADSKQVAVLVPTTILALQHYKTFSERLEAFPVNIAHVSRLRSAARIKQTLKEVSEGKVDIIIGTHRIVSRDVRFKDLGLLIIDEEQKFGVAVKERLKQFKINVDTLTLTATPIPRTLQFSLMGARDLSIIQTPPPNRYPIVTEVHGFNEHLIRDAILYETERNGQVFFIHNRVQNIYDIEEAVHRIVPGVKTTVAHGQMEGARLEKVMLEFINGNFDVLIATTIIESGLDIPNANTMIINHAQSFGLSDLHQLRGRVGRSNKKAFCYLLAPPLSTISPEARRRLKAIEEFSDLGSGFNIAMQDLDIRGAGNLLGAEQSGFIADIGFETYHRILNEAIQELKQGEFKAVFKEDKNQARDAFLQVKFVNDCIIDTDMELLFTDEYIHEIAERMFLYRELDNIENENDLQAFSANLTDRFGELPPQTEELLEVVRLRWQAIKLGIEKIILKEERMICYFVSDKQSEFYKSAVFSRFLEAVQHRLVPGQLKESGNKLIFGLEHVSKIGQAKKILDKLVSAINP